MMSVAYLDVGNGLMMIVGVGAAVVYQIVHAGGPGAAFGALRPDQIAVFGTLDPWVDAGALFLPTMSQGGATGRSAGELTEQLALYGPFVRGGEWYRLITSGFLHYGLLHVGFNMFILYQLGMILEPAFGRVRFALLYLAALLGGSVGALLVSPNALTAGASGAVFGCMAAVVVALRRRGVGVLQSNIGGLLAINLVLTFAVRGISIGGHLGGLAAGAAAGLILDQTNDQPVLGAVAVGALAVALFGAGIAIA